MPGQRRLGLKGHRRWHVAEHRLEKTYGGRRALGAMRFEHLTGARCLAALWILCAHYLPRGPQEAEQVRALYRVDVAVCFFVVASGFVTHWSAKLEDLSCSKLVRYYVRRLGRVLLSYWLALLWHVLLLRRQQALDLGYVLRCACFLEQWLRWCPNGPSWFVFALLPSWLLYPWSRKLVQVAEEHGVPGLLALAFILSAASIGPKTSRKLFLMIYIPHIQAYTRHISL